MKKHDLTVSMVSSYVSYNPDTGIFTRKRSGGKSKSGGIAGKITSYGYRQIRINGTAFLASHLAFLIMEGFIPEVVDHINRDRLDDRWINLREATSQQNSCNRKLFSNNSSGERGVNWHKASSKWQVSIRVKGKLHHYGLFVNKCDAVKKARELRESFHGDFSGIKQD